MSNPTRLRLAAALLMASSLGIAPALADSTFTLDHVFFKGNTQISTDDLVAADGLTEGQKIDRDGIVAAFGKVQDLYHTKNVGGTIQPTMTYPRSGHLNLTFEISELAPQAAVVVQRTLEHETITGNVKVTSDQLAGVLTMKPGQTITNDQVAADQLSIFNVYKGANIPASITEQISYPTPTGADINFVVVENPAPAKPAKKSGFVRQDDDRGQ